jgi:CHAD domain-containing protein
VPADRSPYAEAVVSAEDLWPDPPGKRVVITDPGLRADATVKRILRGLLDTQLRNEAGALAETDTEFLHDYRVAVRRTRALLGQLDRAFPAGVMARFGRQFAELAAVTGPARDWDVFLLALPHLDARLPEAMRGQLDPVRALVVERARVAHARLNARLRSAAYRRFVETWTAFLDKPAPRRPSAELAVAPIGELASRRIWKLFRRLLREGRAITDQSPAEALHELRKTAKKLRYQMELFQDLYDAERLALLLRHLKKLQNLLGEFQDASVQIGHLRDMADGLGRRDASLDSLLAVGALVAILHDDQARQRRHLADVFDKFASHGHRKQFRRLFRPPSDTEQSSARDGTG